MTNNKNIKHIIIIVFFLIIISCFIYIDIKVYQDYSEKKDYLYLSKYVNDNQDSDTNLNTESLPEENIQVDTPPIKTEKMQKLEELHKQNPDIVAWLTIPDTNIDYPVLLTDNNEYYLDHTYKKEYSLRGSLFLDKDTDINPSSDNFLIYGHRNKNGAMFENLLKYENQNFYKTHKIIYLTTLSEDSEYEILAVFRSKVYYKSDKNVFRYYYFVNAKNEKEYNDFVSNAKSASLYDTGIDAKYGEQLLTLSTCAYHTEDGRFAVVAKKKT